MRSGQANQFVEAALDNRRSAEEMLAKHPDLPETGLYAALVTGNLDLVARVLADDPEQVNRKGGPMGWEPLVYTCFSRFAARTWPDARKLVTTARMLLEHEADPNAFATAEGFPDNPLSCLYGATGLNNNPELGLLLLEAGARTEDQESLYHSTEHADLECMRMLLAHGAEVAGTNALKHMLDREDPVGVQLLLDAAADPDERNARGETALHWAVMRARSVRIVRMLVEHGVEMDARRSDGLTAYALAVVSRNEELAEFLREHGADVELPDFQIPKLIPELAMSHRTEAIRALLASGMPVDARSDAGATALHYACWHGYADLAELLLENGASLTVEDAQYHATPAGWCSHGRVNCGEGGDHDAVERVLAHAARS